LIAILLREGEGFFESLLCSLQVSLQLVDVGDAVIGEGDIACVLPV
jgi:hypothetical protein